MKKIIIFIASVLVVSPVIARENTTDDLKGYRCVSNGLRQVLKWGNSSQPRAISRFRRQAMVDLKGRLKLVFPTFYVGRAKNSKMIREYPFPNDVQIQAGIEPSFKMSNKNLDASPRIIGNTVTYRKGDKETYKIITVDLGDKVIKKGDWFGIWVAFENLDGVNKVPYSRLIGSSKEQLYECSYTSYNNSFIKDDFIRTAKKLPLITLNRNYIVGFSPVTILAKTDYKGDVWAIIGSSIPEGYYDIHDNQYGDQNGNLGYADKLISTKLGAPSVNLSKGSDRLLACAKELKGRMDIIKICGINKLHIGLGGNDVYSGYYKMTVACKEIVKQIKDYNPEIIIIGSTILPRSKSNDKFMTIKGQKAVRHMGGHSSVRGKWNKLMRTNYETLGLDDVFELCSYVEHDWKSATGIWSDKKTAPKTFTIDGTHPTCTGSEEIAKHAYLISSNTK